MQHPLRFKLVDIHFYDVSVPLDGGRTTVVERCRLKLVSDDGPTMIVEGLPTWEHWVYRAGQEYTVTFTPAEEATLSSSACVRPTVEGSD